MTAGDNGSVFNNARVNRWRRWVWPGTGDAKPAGGQCFGKGVL